MNGRVNIYELAEATGFSSSTVSKALNKTGRISEKTRKIIMDKAHELNYVASYHAKALSQKKSWIIAVIFSDNLGIGLSHPHFSVILENFKQEVEQAGYEVTFVNRNMGNTEMTYLEFCRYRQVEGVFVANFYSLSNQLPQLVESGIPIVSADGGDLEITTITSDDVQGGKLATEYLIGLGHRKIYHIVGPFYTIAAQDRQFGFDSVMKANGISEYKVFEAANYGFEDGYDQAKLMMKEEELPTAIFVSGDWMALGAIKALRENGIRVPEDISIIGYDNMLFLQYSYPALTTVSQNKRQIGITSAKHLIDKINGIVVESVKIDVEIVERETCKRLSEKK